MKSTGPEIPCESSDVAAAVGAISGKWKTQIVCILFGGTKRFGELRRLLVGIHRGTLTYELRALEADGIIQRTQYLTIPPTVDSPQFNARLLEEMDFDRLVEQGLRVIVLEQDTPNIFGMTTEDVRPRRVFMAAAGHPLFSGCSRAT
jgi:hypothetical protein